jgi:PAS domain S-box-containing protein
MQNLVEDFDWTQTPLGPMSSWPQSLKTVVRILLTSRYAMWMGWGPDLTFLYNDTYGRVTLGKKHPWALGKPACEVWHEIWEEIGPRIQKVLDTGEATWDEALLLFLERNGYAEETYHTFSYSPLHSDDEKIIGMLCVVTEETDRVIGERRLRLLRTLAAELSTTITEGDVLAAIERSLSENRQDLPFACVYLLDDEGVARLSSASGVTRGHPIAPDVIHANEAASVWPIQQVLTQRKTVEVDDLSTYGSFPTGAWQEPPRRAVIVPLVKLRQDAPIGVLIVGVNPMRPFDADYRGFIELVAGQISAAISNARAYEDERRRAESLAEIDRAKTTFFTNISHEFRTPLTLMLGPLEELISARTNTARSSTEDHGPLTLIHRNATRLLKLVNALLDFARIEAGRVNASYELTDLDALTRELAASFDSTTRKAGIKLSVDTFLDRGPVAVDREMWEKIVLNLLSNAFKFTLKGTIDVRLSEDTERNSILLEVADSGIGIPAEDIPRLFERFHRVENAGGRSFEGTGIGLALVKELVSLHQGTLDVDSELGRGSTFRLWISRGLKVAKNSDPPSNPSRDIVGLTAQYVTEALRWLPEDLENDPRTLPSFDLQSSIRSFRPAVLIADDNADMRDYLYRLLSPHYDVVACGNGEEALSIALANPPDLVLTDVMMPRLDGFGFLKRLRAEPKTRTIPVIVLSARAGEEAPVDGFEAGADDYLVKPFRARELIARIRTQLSLRQRSAQFETLVNQAPIGIYVVDGLLRIRQVNPVARPVFGDLSTLIGRDFSDVIHHLWKEESADELVAIFRHTLETGHSYNEPKYTGYRADRKQSEYYEWRVDRISMPEGGFGLVCYFRDISSEVRAEEALRKSEKLAAVGRLASTISHEINNPLESVTNILYIMRTVTTDQAVLEYIQTAEQELQRASHVVHHSLKFHRQSTLPQPERISDLLASTLTVYEPRFKQAGIRIVAELSDHCEVQCYGSELRQVFANLIGNAFDAMTAGGALRLRVRDGKNQRTGERGVRVAIADTGSGMNESTRQHLFDAFFTTKGINGSGLGLWISSEILERHSATVHLKTKQAEAGSGTIFYIFFPLHAISPNFNGAFPIKSDLNSTFSLVGDFVYDDVSAKPDQSQH